MFFQNLPVLPKFACSSSLRENLRWGIKEFEKKKDVFDVFFYQNRHSGLEFADKFGLAPAKRDILMSSNLIADEIGQLWRKFAFALKNYEFSQAVWIKYDGCHE